jgi:hypothetical protein
MNFPPWLREIERDSSDAVSVSGKFGIKIARGARIKKNTLGVFPAGFTASLTQVCEKLVQVGRREAGRAEETALERVCIEFRVEDDRPARTSETNISLHARQERERIRVGIDDLPVKDWKRRGQNPVVNSLSALPESASQATVA